MLRCKPFYRESRNSWYVQIRGEEHKLGSDKEQAFQEFHRLMGSELPTTNKTTVAALVAQFLGWIEQNRKPGTYEWYRNHCESFVKHVGPRLRVSDVKPYHVDKWLKSHSKNRSVVTVGERRGRQTKRTGTENSKTYLNGGCRAVARAFNWAQKQGLLAASPIKGMERPAAKRRDEYLTLEQWAQLLALVKPSDPFYDLLVFLWETGARPFEARMARADNFHAETRQIILDLEDSKGEKYQRVIMLNDRAFEIVSRLASDGPIFKHGSKRAATKKSNRDDAHPDAWEARSIQCRFKRLSTKLGYKVIPYVIRHSWITHALLRGVDPLTVGILAGHKDATQVMRTYQHLARDRAFLAAKLRQATGESAA